MEVPLRGFDGVELEVPLTVVGGDEVDDPDGLGSVATARTGDLLREEKTLALDERLPRTEKRTGSILQ